MNNQRRHLRYIIYLLLVNIIGCILGFIIGTTLPGGESTEKVFITLAITGLITIILIVIVIILKKEILKYWYMLISILAWSIFQMTLIKWNVFI